MGEPLRRVAVLTHYLTGATAEALAQLSPSASASSSSCRPTR